jgi:DNA-binding CsgD family transcriptional regulator
MLGISSRTVQIHVAHIFDKLGVRSRAGAAVSLVEHDLLK